MLGLGDDLPPALTALFDLRFLPERADRLRALFAARGAAVRQVQTLAEAEARLGEGGVPDAAGNGDAQPAAQALPEPRTAMPRALQNERDALGAQLAATRRHLDAVLASTSWLLTAPLPAAAEGAAPRARLARRVARFAALARGSRLAGGPRERRVRTREPR